MRFLYTCISIVFLAQFIAADDSPVFADTQFLYIDLTTVEYPTERGVEPMPFIVWYDNIVDGFRTWLMTLDDGTGMQLGERFEIFLPNGKIPADIMWSWHILYSSGRGVEPVPFHLFRDHSFYVYPTTWAPDGTPSTGPPIAFSPMVSPDVYGYASSIAEMPGTEFADGFPRLCIGTQGGYIIVLMNEHPGEIHLSQIIAISDVPVIDLEPIPQYAYIALGVLTNNMIYGLDLDPEPGKGLGRRDYLQVFILHDPRPYPLTDFDVFGSQDEQLPDPDDTARLILVNGSEYLARASLDGQQIGSEYLALATEAGADSIDMVAPGSLLMISSDGSSVIFDPAYSEYTGSSGCAVEITDTINDGCSYDVLCGDANGDETINIADAVYIIDYVFKGGPPPDPLCVGDPNGDGSVNVADAVYLINYIFKGGPAPVEDCCP